MASNEADSKQRILDTIEQTGFELEFYVQNQFRKAGWNVIPNRYYIDDQKGTEREIDVIAYRTVEVHDILFYTVLIISCKKRNESRWVFLTQNKVEDVNYDSFPVSLASSDERLKLLIDTEKEMIIKKIKDKGKIRNLYDSQNRIFAYLQINTKSHKVEDSPAIYDSIITPIKAMEWEMMAHQKSTVREKKTFYCYNMLSVFDGDMCEVRFDSEGNKEYSLINDIKYINRHILNKQEKFYRVHFTTKGNLSQVINDYQMLFVIGSDVFSGLVDEFYNDIWLYRKRVSLIEKKFARALSNRLRWICTFENTESFDGYKEIDDIYLSSYNKGIEIHVCGYDTEQANLLSQLNGHVQVRKEISKLLQEYYRYNGEFTLTDELPF